MTKDRYPHGPQRGETQFTAHTSREEYGPIARAIGCILGFVFVGLPLLFLGFLAVYGMLHGYGSGTSSMPKEPYAMVAPTLPSPPPPYRAEFQVHGKGAPQTVLTVSDELIQIIAVARPEDIPKEKREAAAKNAVVGGARPTILVGDVTVTVAALEETDLWTGHLLLVGGDFREAILRTAGGSAAHPRPPPGFPIIEGRPRYPEISTIVESVLRPPRPIREIYVVGQVQAIFTPSLFHGSVSTTKIVDLDLRVPASEIAAYERSLSKFVDDTRRYEHRYDPLYRIQEEKESGGSYEIRDERPDSRPIDHPVEAHPMAIP